MELKLFSDRISHPARACLLLLRSLQKPFHEEPIAMFKGQHFKHPMLQPLRKIPVLQVTFSNSTRPDLFIRQSTSILRFAALTSKDVQLPTGIDWYPENVEERIKIDEYFDFWQSGLNAAFLQAARQNLFYKVVLKYKQKDPVLSVETINEYVKQQSLFRDHFLAGKPFLLGDKLSIADLLASVSLEQVRAVDKNLVDDDNKLNDYLERCKLLLPEFDEMHKEIRQMPEQFKKMGLL